jgi:hypothetical protein
MRTIGTSEELATTFSDTMVLLEFLGRRGDCRLQAHFDDTRGDLAVPGNKLATPPCKSYRHFLNRLMRIGEHPSGTGSTGGEQPARPAEDDDGLADAAFLSFSRDFLAAVASPATVDSIRVTRAYVDARRQSTLRWLTGWLRHGGSVSVDPTVNGAHRLATRAVWIENIAIALTAFTLLTSAYAFSGKLILDNRQAIFDNYDQINREQGTVAKDIALAGDPRGTALAGFNPARPPSYCDPAAEPADGDRPEEASFHLTSDGGPNGTAVPATAKSAAASAERCALYWHLKRANEDLVAVTLHLVSWTQVVIGDRSPLSIVFGIDRKSMLAAAALHQDWCKTLQFTQDRDGNGCGQALRDLIFRTKEVADAVLGCITLYVLPTLYGCLGAAAYALRELRRKVDLSLVTMTDRGRLQQDMILGLLCGAIMGLFFGYIGKGTAATGLGLSAVALLAGYNVSGAFALLDELSNRVFRPAKAAGP